MKATPHLAYTPCFGEYQCAKLEVPLDWNETTPGPKAQIAIIRLPAQVPVTDPRYGGAIIINPGGPGESGVNEVLTRGKLFQSIADNRNVSLTVSDGQKYFDLVSFDPRGINNSTPHLQCFPDAMARRVWEAQASAEGLLESTDRSFDLMWARAKALGQACADDGTGIAQFINTAPVVADMVAIIERHGEWREQEAKHLLKALSGNQRQAAAERTRWRRGEEQLQYWGFSYGTILGQTFATLQPSRVSRFVLDGVVDIGDYYSGDWKKNLRVTDQIVDKFAEYCFRAGPSKCAFHAGSAQTVKRRLDDLLAAIKEEPVFAVTAAYGPDIFTYSDLLLELRESLYLPLLKFPEIAKLLAALETPHIKRSAEIIADHLSQAEYRATQEASGYGGFVTAAIDCSDALDLTSLNKTDIHAYAKYLVEQSNYLGRSWVSIRTHCSGWVTRPKWPFDYTTAGGKADILFVGNTLDPVTPMANARAMAAMWQGSGLLEVAGEGHCTYAVESACAKDIIGHYFQTGEMPAPGKVCEVDKRPFDV